MQLCQICKKNHATFTKFVPSMGGVIPICMSCFGGVTTTVTTYYSNIKTLIGRQSVPTTHIVCTNCGFDLNDFRKHSRLGCSNCYSVFEQQLAPLIRQIHGVNV